MPSASMSTANSRSSGPTVSTSALGHNHDTEPGSMLIVQNCIRPTACSSCGVLGGSHSAREAGRVHVCAGVSTRTTPRNAITT